MNRSTENELRSILHEAHVIDFDFSQWDVQVTLVVAAGLEDPRISLPGIRQIIFEDVSEILWITKHLPLGKLPPGKHMQWVVMDSQISHADGIYCVDLLSVAPPCPSTRIKCRNVIVKHLDSCDIDTVNPIWNRPYCPLARPGIEALAAAIRKKND